jgi:hydrogenase maturation protease
MKRILVIGYGNGLRSDDGAGIAAAEKVSEALPELEVITSFQLQPELAEAIARNREVIFIDASFRVQQLSIREIGPRELGNRSGSHMQTPEGLLALARAVYGEGPERALFVEIPARSVEFGEGLTPATAADVERVVDLVRAEAALPASPNQKHGV